MMQKYFYFVMSKILGNYKIQGERKQFRAVT